MVSAAQYQSLYGAQGSSEITGEDRSGVQQLRHWAPVLLSADLAEELICFEPVLIFMRYI